VCVCVCVCKWVGEIVYERQDRGENYDNTYET